MRSGSIPRHHPRPQARKASIGSKAGKAHPALSRTTERVGAIVLIRSSVRIYRCHMVPNRRNRQAERTRRGTPGGRPANPRSGINKGKAVLHEKPIYMEAERDNVAMEIALQYNDAYSETVFCFANNINTVDGGTHLSGFKTALTRTINAAGQSCA